MANKDCVDDKDVIYDIIDGDNGVRFDGVIVTVEGDLDYDHSGAFFTYYDMEEKQEVWDYCRNFKWSPGLVERPRKRTTREFIRDIVSNWVGRKIGRRLI